MRKKYLAVGQKAAFFCQTDNFVDIVAGGGGYGFEGIKKGLQSLWLREQ